MGTADITIGAWIIGSGKPSFYFDCIARESHSSELAITEDPVETGVTISDHAFLKPRHLEVENYVGDIWLRMRAAVDPRTVTANAAPAETDFAWLNADPGDESTRSQRAFQLLLGLQASAEPFDVKTTLRTYQNMLVESIQADRDAQNTWLGFHATLREILIVNTQTVIYPPRAAGSPTRQASKKVTAGEQTPAQVTDINKQKTIAKSGLDAVTAGKLDFDSLVGALKTFAGAGD